MVKNEMELVIIASSVPCRGICGGLLNENIEGLDGEDGVERAQNLEWYEIVGGAAKCGYDWEWR
jgi:hypothetical protein